MGYGWRWCVKESFRHILLMKGIALLVVGIESALEVPIYLVDGLWEIVRLYNISCYNNNPCFSLKP